MLSADHVKILQRIKMLTEKGAGLDYGGKKHNRRDRRLVNEMLDMNLLTSSGNPRDRCIVGLTDAGQCAITSPKAKDV